MWALGLLKLLQDVRLLYRNLDGGRGLSVAVGVRFMLAGVLQVGLVYIPKSLCFPFLSWSLYWRCILVSNKAIRSNAVISWALPGPCTCKKSDKQRKYF
jgi:hypothetical protein